MREPDCSSPRRFAGPLYAQVSDELREKITSGDWPPGWAFPNETELARDYQVSVGTMRKALGLLEDEQLIIRRRGRGTFVAKRDHADPWRFCFNLYVNDRQIEATCRSTRTVRDIATDEEAEHLLIPGQDHVVRMFRKYVHQNRTIALEKIVVPAGRFPNIADYGALTDVTLFDTYYRLGNVSVARLTEEVSTARIDDLLQPDHDGDEGRHLLSRNRVAFDAGDRPIEWSLVQVLLEDARILTSRSRSDNWKAVAA